MPGHRHGPSIKHPDVYEALRRKGYSKTKAAKISNARGHRGGKKRRSVRRGRR
jgi:hypothetical protein